MMWLSISRMCGESGHSISRYLSGTLLYIFLFMISQVQCDHHHVESGTQERHYAADIKYTYIDPNNHVVTSHFEGKYGVGHQPVKANVSGKVLHVTSLARKDKAKENNFGCEKYNIKLPTVTWVALVQRGECSFSKKLTIATIHQNASAVLIYDNETQEGTLMQHQGKVLTSNPYLMKL